MWLVFPQTFFFRNELLRVNDFEENKPNFKYYKHPVWNALMNHFQIRLLSKKQSHAMFFPNSCLHLLGMIRMVPLEVQSEKCIWHRSDIPLNKFRHMGPWILKYWIFCSLLSQEDFPSFTVYNLSILLKVLIFFHRLSKS